MDVLKTIELIAGGLGALALFWSGFRGNLNNDTIKLMKENKQAADDAIKRLEDDASDKTKQIANLSGQIQTLKDIPLAQIAKSLEVVSTTHQDMQIFLKNQQAQAEDLADGIAGKVIQFLRDKDKQ